MFDFVNFGNFKECSEEEYNEDKNRFYKSKLRLLSILILGYSAYEQLKKEQISKMDNIIKQKLSGNCKHIDFGLSYFLEDFGICYDFLSIEIKKELLTFDYTYENFKMLTIKMYNEFIEDAKKDLPKNLYICLDEKGFIAYCQIIAKTKIKKNNFIRLIRDYFILDGEGNSFSTLRNQQLFGEIRMKMIEIYPTLKDIYGPSRKMDLFLSYFDEDNDYNNNMLKYILNNYYENKNKNINNKYIPIKQNDN